MNQVSIRYRVFLTGNNHKPIFERIVTKGISENTDTDLIVRALRVLFGASVTVNVEYYAV